LESKSRDFVLVVGLPKKEPPYFTPPYNSDLKNFHNI